MPTQFSNTLIGSNDTDAHFQAWIGFVDSLLTTTGGWVNTSDTGQTPVASFLHPTVTASKQGYRVYRMNDALQATAPVFMRIDFGSGSGSATYVYMWVTIGTGTDGAGNITGLLVNQLGITQNQASPTQSNNSYGSAASARFSMALFIQGTNPSILIIFTLERTKDASGNDTAEGLLLSYSDAGNPTMFRYSQWVSTTPGPQPPVENGVSFALTTQNPTQAFAPGNIGIGVIIPFRGVAVQPGTNAVMANTSDVAAEGQFQTVLYGNTRTYQQVRMKSIRASGSASGDATSNVCIRYD